MKCHKCNNKAVIRMRQHRVILCKEHYLEWFIQQTKRFIDKYHMFTQHDRILIAVSGGKDSLAVWDVLWRLGYQADGLYINLGIPGDDRYSDQSEEYTKNFARERNLNLITINVKEQYGETIPEIAKRSRRGKNKPCAACGLVKRHIMNKISHENNYDVLVTGHNLDDEVAVLFGNLFNWQINMLKRQAPVLEEIPGLTRKAKPLCRFTERETAAYTILQGIPYEYEECPFSEGSTSIQYKILLNKIEEEQPGAKLRFYVGFLKARKNDLFFGQENPIDPDSLQFCQVCGQPTTAPGTCAFCRMMEKSPTDIT